MRKRRPPQRELVALFPIVLFYYEIIFRLSTVGGLFKWGTIHMLFFCVAYGGLGYLVGTLFRNPRHNRYCVTAYLAISALPYLIEYFVYRKFKILYDLNTVFGGASDAVGNHYLDIIKMIFSFSGILRIVLFLLPTILYVILGKIYINPRRSNKRRRIIVIFLTSIIYFINLLFVWILPSQRTMWNTQYSFETAVRNFGLASGIRLDLKNIVFGKSENSFDLDVHSLDVY